MKLLKIVSIVLLTFIGFLSLSLIVAFIALLFSRIALRVNDFENLLTYQHSKINPSTKKRGYGAITSSKHIDDLEKFYIDENGDYNLISRFGEDEYQCFGSCYCDSIPLTQRRSSNVISRGLTYLVAATTSVFAFHQAKTYFDDECVRRYEDECDLDSIHSEVDNCGMLSESSTSSTEKEETEETTTTTVTEKVTETEEQSKTQSKTQKKRKQKKGKNQYVCRGACIARIHGYSRNPELKFWRGTVKKTQLIRFYFRVWKIVKDCPDHKLEDVKINAKNIVKAYETFLKKDLEVFCAKSSLYDFERKDGSAYSTNTCVASVDNQLVQWGISKDKGNSPVKGNGSVFCEEFEE